MFDIEMLPADHGDCLWLTYGDAANPRRILIDAGTPGTWKRLRSRLAQSVAANGGTLHFELFVVTHVDVPPPFKDTTVPLLQQLAEASRKDAGNLRFEVQQQGNRPNHFTVVEQWADQKTYDAHVMAAHTRQFRDKLGPMSGALYDERLYRAVD